MKLQRMAAWTLADRFIARERETGIDGAVCERRAHAFAFVFFVLYASELIATNLRRFGEAGLGINHWIEVGAVGVAAILMARERWRRIAFGLMAGVALMRLTIRFPMAGNHLHIHAIIFTLLALLDPKVEVEREWLLGALKWLLLVILFYSGLQKLLHGHYLNGEFFAYTISESASFRQFLRWVLPAGEVERIVQYGWAVGTGPYRLYSPTGLFISRAAVAAEMLLPLLLWFRRTRVAGIVAAAAFIVVIELAARELYFGLLFLNLLLLFAPAGLHIRTRWVFVIIGVGLIFSRLGVLPEVHFG
jgi:hypothetical protein